MSIVLHMLHAVLASQICLNEIENSKYKEAKASPGFLFWKMFNSWQRLIRESLEPLRLTQVQYSILAVTSYLESAEHVTQQNVSDQR